MCPQNGAQINSHSARPGNVTESRNIIFHPDRCRILQRKFERARCMPPMVRISSSIESRNAKTSGLDLARSRPELVPKGTDGSDLLPRRSP